MTATKTFHWLDYLIFILTLVISAAIGIFYGWRDRKRQSTSEVLLGGRRMSTLPVALSLMASFLSAVLVLGVPTEIFYNGTMYWLISFSNIITFPVAVHAFLPVFHKLELTSAYEYLELRFNKVIRTLGCIVFQIQMLLYMAVVLYAPALALNQVMGFSMLVSILVIGLVCTFYTAIGGLKAVMWTDTFQMLIVFAGLVALVIKATIEVGGFQFVWDTARKADKLHADNFDPDPFVRHTFWTLVIGGFVTSMTIYGSNQAMIQRYLSMESVRSAQIALYWNLPAAIIFTTLLVYTGLVLFAKYGEADPVGCAITRRDQMIPWLVMDVLGDYHGFPGLMVACIFSASLSTVSSGVNALALVFVTDVLKPVYKAVTKTRLNEIRAAVYSKFIAMVFGLLTIGLAFLAEKMGSLILQITLSIFGMVGGPLLGLFVMALFFPCVNSLGAGCGLIASIAFIFWLAIGSIVNRGSPPTVQCATQMSFANTTTTFPLNTTTYGIFTEETTSTFNVSTVTEHLQLSGLDKFYSMSYMWYSTIAVLVGLIVAVTISLITGGTRNKPVDSRLLSPLYLYLTSFAEIKSSDETLSGTHEAKYVLNGKSGNGKVSSIELNSSIEVE